MKGRATPGEGAPTAGFVSFPGRDEILVRLRQGMPGARERPLLLAAVAERLAGRTYDGAALAFILMEILYEHEDEGEALEPLLPTCIVALTGDEELGRDAGAAFAEIRELVGA